MSKRKEWMVMSVSLFHLFTLSLLLGCQQANDGKCHIEGVVIGEQYEGKRIFLVPDFLSAELRACHDGNGRFDGDHQW